MVTGKPDVWYHQTKGTIFESPLHFSSLKPQLAVSTEAFHTPVLYIKSLGGKSYSNFETTLKALCDGAMKASCGKQSLHNEKKGVDASVGTGVF